MSDTVTLPGHYLIQQVERLSKAEYEIVRNSILKNLSVYGAMTSTELEARVKKHLKQKLHASLWPYYAAVRQDLEARGELEIEPVGELIAIAD